MQFGGITVELGANWVHRLQSMIKKQPYVIKSIKVFVSVEYYQNIRATQSKKDGKGMRYNPIEDLVKVTFCLLYVLIN